MAQKPHPVHSDELIRVRDYLFNITIRGNRANSGKLFNGYHSENDLYDIVVFDEASYLNH